MHPPITINSIRKMKAKVLDGHNVLHAVFSARSKSRELSNEDKEVISAQSRACATEKAQVIGRTSDCDAINMKLAQLQPKATRYNAVLSLHCSVVVNVIQLSN